MLKECQLDTTIMIFGIEIPCIVNFCPFDVDDKKKGVTLHSITINDDFLSLLAFTEDQLEKIEKEVFEELAYLEELKKGDIAIQNAIDAGLIKEKY